MARRRHARGCCLTRILTFAILVLTLVYPFWEAYHLTEDIHPLRIDRLPSSLKALKIIYLTDIHQGSFYSQGRVDNLVTQINSYNADIVLLGGDYANDSNSAIAFFQNMPKIHARYLVAGVVGNHDRTTPESNLAALQSAMVNAGVLPLVNSVKTLKIGTATLCLAGVDDYNNGYPDINGVAAQISEEDFTIFMTHSPDNLPKAFTTANRAGSINWFDIALCGHTHGGQVTLLGMPLFRTYSLVSDRYLSGWLQENRAHILISNGVGTSWVPARLFAKPQIHIITLQ